MSRKPNLFVKYDVHGMLFGNIKYDLSPAEISVWDRFLALAKIGEQEGVISSREWNKESLVVLFNLTPYGGIDLLQSTIDKCVKSERIQVSEDGSMIITNWHKYQDVPEWIRRQQESKEKAIARAKAEKKPQTIEVIIPEQTQEKISDFTNAVKKFETITGGAK